MEYIDSSSMSSLDVSTIHKLNVSSRLNELPMNSDSNISPHAVGMSVKMELQKRRSTQTQSESQTMYSGCFNKTMLAGMSDIINEASNIIKKLDNTANSLVFREALATRMELRSIALKNFSKHNYSDALLQAHYSLLLAKKFHLQVRNTPLCGEMAMELLILSKCYAHIGHFNKGREHLSEFKFLVENTLMGYSGGSETLSPDAKYSIIDCDKKLFLNIVFLLSEILTSYGMWQDAEVFFAKYLTLYTHIYGEFDLGLTNALNSVCIYMLKSKQYLKALPLAIKSLEILKKHYGDYESETPNMRVADGYNNLGIIYRLVDSPVDAMQQFFKAIDMKMRILDDRNHPAIQDIFLSIGCCLHVLGHFRTTAAIYSEVYITRSDALGKMHPSTISVQHLLKELEQDIALKSETTIAEHEDVMKNDEKEYVTDKNNTPLVDITKIRSLYSTKIENQLTNKCKIDLCDEMLYPTDRLVDLSKKINSESLMLPVINVPKLSRGTLYLKDGLPALSLNPDAEDMLRQWGFNPPDVDVFGEFDKSELTEDGISLYIPIVDDQNNPLLGYHDKPLYVPNPAVYHTAKQQARIKSNISLQFKNFSPFDKKTIFSSDKSSQFESRSSRLDLKAGSGFFKTDQSGSELMSSDPKSQSVSDMSPKSGGGISSEDDLNEYSSPSGSPFDSNSVKAKIGEFERMKSVKFVEKPKIVEEPIVVVPITELIKNKIKNPNNAKFLAKIGALKNINVKNLAPKVDNGFLKKSKMAKTLSSKIAKKVAFKDIHPTPRHKRMLVTDSDIEMDSTPSSVSNDFNMYTNSLDSDSDNDTVIYNDNALSCSETPVNSDYESLNEYSLTNMIFTSPLTAASVEVDTPVATAPITRLVSKSVEQKLPLFLTNRNDILPVDVAKRVKLIRIYVDKLLCNFNTSESDESSKPNGSDKSDVESNKQSSDDKTTAVDSKPAENNTDSTITPKAKLVPVPSTPPAPTTDAEKVVEKSDDDDNQNKSDVKVNKNMCVLLDSEGNELAFVPWTIDLVSLSLAKSCLQEDFLNRYAYLYKLNKEFLRKKPLSFGVETDEERKKNELILCRMLLAGQGLEELGFAKIATSIKAISSDLSGGLTFKVPNSILENMKQQQQILEKQQRALEDAQKQKEELLKKEAAVKKAPPAVGKKAPPPPASKKAPPPPLGKKAPLPAPAKKGLTKTGKKAPAKIVESNVRRFFWDPIFGDDAKDTMFAKQKVTPKVETSNIEESFAKATPKMKEKKQDTKPKFIQLLPDSKRSYNMNIGLSKFNKHSFNELREAIVHLDPNILTIDATESLLLLLPTNEELSIVSEFVKSGGDLSMVDKPEQFVASLVGIPIMKQRLECHQSALTFKDNYNEIYEPLETILDSCEAVMGSIKLNILSNFILSVGNTLNEGDPKKGNAEGFKPTTYPKLNDFRTTTKPSRTLLQFICDIVGEEDESILDLIDEMKCLDAASKVDVVALDERMNRFKNDLTKIKNAINLAQNAKSDYNDHFPSIMNEFLRDAEPKITSLAKHYESVMHTFKETVRFSGYTEKEVDKIKPAELFKYLWSFVQSVEQCRKQRQEARTKLEKKNAAQSKTEVKKAVKQQTNNPKLTAVPKLLNNDMVNIVKSI